MKRGGYVKKVYISPHDIENMEIIYHPDFKDPSYASDPAAKRGRIQCIIEELEKEERLNFSKPGPASPSDLKRVHTAEHLRSIRERREKTYRMGALAAGASLQAARSAFQGNPAFAVVRPPGHHASPDSCWGFCYFNNMAVAVEGLREEGKIKSAFIMDFDLHTGDGNMNCLGDDPDVSIMNPISDDRKRYQEEVKERLAREKSYDMLGVSAGFDEHVEDWGGKLKTEDYRKIGSSLKRFSEKRCSGRRFALLEGGYNHEVLGKNVRAFVQGFSD
ncbi:MAG: histone deacetylase family protein [Candidatus Natronoplasma sp.]